MLQAPPITNCMAVAGSLFATVGGIASPRSLPMLVNRQQGARLIALITTVITRRGTCGGLPPARKERTPALDAITLVVTRAFLGLDLSEVGEPMSAVGNLELSWAILLTSALRSTLDIGPH